MLNQGSRDVASSSSHWRPGLAGLLERPQDRFGRHAVLEGRIHAELHGAAGETPQLLVRAEDLRLDARHHARDGLVGDLREGLLAEGEEGHVGAVTQQQELEVVMPHPEVALERLLVDVEELVVRGHAAPGVDVLERLELRQLGRGQRLRVADQREHLLAPLRVEAFPVLVVVEGPLLELFRPARDLVGVGDGVAADVDAPVDDPVIDPEGRRQAVDPRVGGAQRAIRGLRSHHVEGRHGLGEMHGVVEPEALVVRGAELDVVGISRLRALQSRESP